MSRRTGLLVGAVVLLVVAGAVAGAVVVSSAVARWLEEDPGLNRVGSFATPTVEQVDSALRFGALAALPPGAQLGPLRTEQGIDGLVVLRVRMAPGQVGPWLAGSGMPPPEPAAAPVPTAFDADLPTGTPVVPQHWAARPGGGLVARSGTVVAAGVVEVRAFET